MNENIVKPKWLEQLEAESWQAELIISGIAIFASTFLPEIAERFVTFVLTSTPPSDHLIFYYAFLYLYIGVYVVTTGLIVHFVARAFWIGLIGFNSVFPRGIDLEHDAYYSNYYVRKIASHLPTSADDMIQKLDRFCSPIFAIIGMIVMFSVVLVFDLTILYLLKSALSFVLPDIITGNIFTAFLIVSLFAAALMMILNTKKLKENRRAQHIFYRTSYIFNFGLLHIFFVPVQYLTMSLFTTTESKNTLRSFFLFSFLGGLLAAPALVGTNFKYFADYNNSGIYLREFDRPHEIQPVHYENLRLESPQQLLSAMLKSDEITGSQFELFVPIFNNERSLHKDCRDAVEISEDLEKPEQNQLKRATRLQCYKDYHHFSIDDLPVEALSGIVAWHPHQEEYGMRFYFSTADLKTGLHVIRIEKKNTETTEIFRTISIPFHFMKD